MDLGIRKNRVQSIQENILEKGGEGSRGGKIIGHTKSGKPVYENRNAMAEKKYTSKDHDDASYAHLDHNKKTEGKRNEHHTSEFDRHHDTSQYKKKNEELESEDKKEGKSFRHSDDKEGFKEEVLRMRRVYDDPKTTPEKKEKIKEWMESAKKHKKTLK